jgi:ATP-dependent DNA helicase RecQ
VSEAARTGEEHVQATLALQGLEPLGGDDREPASGAGSLPPLRPYGGPRDPEALLAHLGLERFRPGQRDAVEAALGGRDALVVMPTGDGKSLCYQLPGIASEELTIVVSPLIALMADQWRRLRLAGHPVVMLASGLGEAESRAALDAIRGGQARIAYCSPERFGSTTFLDAIARRRVDLFAIDEAHCLSEWGHDFRPDYLRLPRAIERLGRPAVMACTATATEAVAEEVVRRLGLREPVSIRSGFDRPNISFDVIRLEGKGAVARKRALLEHGLRDLANRPAIVYCGTRRDTEAVAADLRTAGLVAVGYHAGMDPDERASAQHRFMTGDADVVVATNAFGMGVDKADVRSVWHWALPTSVEAYYQEAGRAGRDGAPARAVLLAMRSDLGRLVRFNQRREVTPEEIAAYLTRLRGEADAEGALVIDNPRDDTERVRLAIAERAGACSVEPAPGGRLRIALGDSLHRGRATAECRVAKDRGWRAYRAIEAFSFSDGCRRRMLLRHFGDRAEPAPLGRCCDQCARESLLPDPQTIAVPASRRSRSSRAGQPPEPDLAPADQRLLERLREWRLDAAAGKPAYTVAHNRTLAAIASARPGGRAELAAIPGIGPAFLDRHAADVLAMVAAAE